MAAIAIFYPDQKAVHIEARLVFYGSEASPAVAQKIVQEINRMYNEPRAEVLVAGQRCRVSFVIEYAVLTTEDAFRRISENTDFRNNFIRLEKENIITRSFMGFGLGENAGHWIITDQLGTSTTAAHEFGHSLGLDHPARLDYRGSNTPPPIMAPRGTLVDPHYQWEPSARAGEIGGTMKPIYRRVSVEEIELIVSNLTFGTGNTALVGRLSNIAFDEIGHPAPTPA
ncbi:MAG: peptidase M10 [Bacteroidetes bacterium]|nr:peptidase M10 [Bacteroidota bacterium]